MHIAVSDAKARLTDLVRRAEAGDEIILTRHGHPAVRLTPVNAQVSPDALRERRRKAIDRAIEEARARGSRQGPDAARAADFLYGEDGLPA